MTESIVRTTSPVSGLRALLSESVDYAGLFPPANLSLQAAVRNYTTYRSGPYDWLLSRFVCPSSRLEDLEVVAGALAHPQRMKLSLLGLPDSLSQRQVEAVELTLSPDLLEGDSGVIRAAIARTAEAVESSGSPTAVTPFLEVTAKERWHEAVDIVLESIADHNARWQGVRCGPAGFKMRTGGVTPDAFPPAEDLAFVISACSRLGVAFKCTAGLHHPVRHYSDSIRAKMHGFLNVYVAAILAHAGSLSDDDIRTILEDEEPRSFHFDDDGVCYQGMRAVVEQISDARKSLITSFGSCSFEEPVEDLRKLQLL
jgi:hypothetical protein